MKNKYHIPLLFEVEASSLDEARRLLESLLDRATADNPDADIAMWGFAFEFERAKE